MTEYCIATNVLEAIVRGSLETDDRLHPHASLPLLRSHPFEVVVEGDTCRASLQLDARFGEYLPALATVVREKVVDALGGMTGLTVTAVDVIFAGVLPVNSRP